MVCVLIDVGLVVTFALIFFMFLGMITYGAKLEQKYQQLLDGYKQLLEEKEKQK